MALTPEQIEMIQQKKRGPKSKYTLEEKEERRRESNRKAAKARPDKGKTIRFHPDVLAILEKHVARTGTNFSAVLREALMEYDNLYPITK